MVVRAAPLRLNMTSTIIRLPRCALWSSALNGPNQRTENCSAALP